MIAASIRKIISSGADLDFENLPAACPTAPCPPNPRIAALVPGSAYKVTFGGLNLQDLAITGSHPGITFSATERDPIGTLVTGVLEVDETAPDGEYRIHVQNNFGSDYFRVLIRTGSGVDASIESLDEKPEWIQALADREIVTMETLNTFQSAGGSDLESTISTEGALRCIASPDVVLNYNLIVARALFSYTLFDCPRDPEPLRQVCLRAVRGVEDQLNLRVRTFGANVFFGVRIQVGFRIQALQIGPFAFQFLIPVCVPRVGGYFIGMDVNGLFEVRLDSGDRRRNVFQWRINPPVVLGFNPPTAFSYINPGTGEEIPACQRPCRTTDPGQQPVKPCACPDIPGQLVGPNGEPIFVVVVTEPRSAEQWPEITARIPVHSALINVNVNLNSRARVNVSRLGIELAQPARGADFPISAGPANPTVNALARIRGITPDPTSETNFTWSTLLRLQLTRSRVSEVTLPPQTVRGGAFTPNWNSIGIRGGVLLLRTEATADGQPLRAETRGVTVHGTNPGATAINDHLNRVLKGAPDSHIFTASQIACWENGLRQFDAAREGGIGWPSINPESGATGIMQLLDPPASDDAVWNWQANIEEGVSTLAGKRADARNHHIGERTRLNQERGPGNHCPAGVPPPLSDQRMPGTPWAVVSQLERETIRRYNCGREHRWEPRDAPNCAGSWVVRPYLSRGECDGNYVERVLNCR